MPVNGQKARAVRNRHDDGSVPDRRVSRTRRTLLQAFFVLLEERPYDTITVTEICERAEVGRSAFYEHFAGKDSLFRTAFERLEGALARALEREHGAQADVMARRRVVLQTLFRHAADHARLYRAIARQHSSRIADVMISNILAPYLLSVLDPGNEVPRHVLELRLAATQAALLAALHWWLDRGARLDVDTIVDEMMLIHPKGTRGWPGEVPS